MKTRMRSFQTLARPLKVKSSSEVLTSFIFNVSSCIGTYDSSSGESSNDTSSQPSALFPFDWPLRTMRGSSAIVRIVNNVDLDFMTSPLCLMRERAVTLGLDGSSDSAQRFWRKAVGLL